MVVDVMEGTIRTLLNKENIQLKYKCQLYYTITIVEGRHQHHDYEDNITIVLTIMKISQP